MKKTLLFFLFLIYGCSSIDNLQNDFGEVKIQQSYLDRNVPIRIYFDRWGAIYPDCKINNDLFKKHYSALDSLYRMEKSVLTEVFKGENLQYNFEQNGKENIERLEIHLDDKYADLIDKKSEGKTLVFLIHGYNNTGESASAAFRKLQTSIGAIRPNQKFQFVEIYWDGLTNGGNPFNTVKIWGYAQYNAAFVGLGLRRILNKLKSKHTYVITHSHGAGVITEALLNATRFKPEFYTDDKGGKEILELRNNKLYDSPTSKFTIGMLAPAIPGINVFQDYYMRTVDGKNIKQEQAQYRFINGFNKYDIATSKGFLSGYIGATTLACKEKEDKKVRDYFEGNTSIYDRVVFSKSKGKKQRSHAVQQYVKNENFLQFVDKVFDTSL